MKRSMGFAAAILAAALPAVVVQAPAQATPKLEKHYAVSQFGDTLTIWFWIEHRAQPRAAAKLIVGDHAGSRYGPHPLESVAPHGGDTAEQEQS